MTLSALHISSRQKLAAVSGAACVALALAAGVFWLAVDEIRQGERRQAYIQQRVEDLADERRRTRVSEGLLRDRQEDIRRISAFFAPRKSPIAFIEAAEGAAARTGNTIVLDADETASTETALRFRVTVQGGADHLLDFVRVLELLPYPIDIRDMVFQNASQNASGAVPATDAIPVARLLLSLDVGAR